VDRVIYLTFVVSGEECALEVVEAEEPVAFAAVRPASRAAPCVRGALCHGTVNLLILDVAVRFGLPPSPLTTRTCVVPVRVMLGGEVVLIGLLADDARGVRRHAESDLEPPAFGTAVEVVTVHAGDGRPPRRVLRLDFGRLLSTAEIDDLRDAGAAGARDDRRG
jgi:purine-binding chemotaxis protein CheW